MGRILCLDLGTKTGYAVGDGRKHACSGVASFATSRYEGGGMRFLRFANWLDELFRAHSVTVVYFEEVRRHMSTDAAHVYGGFLAQLTAKCELCGVAYQGVPVGTIKKHATGKGNAGKEAIIEAMRAKGYAPADDNEADALAIYLWAVEQGK